MLYKLKSTARSGALFSAAAALAVATIAPAMSVSAENLNPLTERSLLLSSSAPGYQDTDGSGNSENSPNAVGEYYALPGSGPNGKKTGETFTFNVSTDSVDTSTPIQAFSLQYCTVAAGLCQAPGNNAGDARDDSREDNATAHALETPTSDFDVVTDDTTPWSEGSGEGQFQVSVDGTASTGWEMSTANAEDDDHSGDLTGKNNMIYLTNDAAGASPEFNETIEVKFTPNTENYITNPGADEFFVKINTYSVATEADLLPTTDANIIDGGVTVANVMTESIHITTKVLETMSFSVGTQNPDTEAVQHGSCDAINAIDDNRLDLGNPNAENSLETGTAYDTDSYWRLSSNSSGGATVYYSGDTLRNTVGDHIADMPAKAHSQPGTEQFGLALIDAGQDELDAEVHPAGHEDEGDLVRPFPTNWVTPNIAPLNVESDYADGGYDTDGTTLLPISNEVSEENAQFTFHQTSKDVPEVIAQNSDEVISCATSKVRYVGNIAADTPAGVYTTKINYLAAPQY